MAFLFFAMLKESKRTKIILLLIVFTDMMGFSLLFPLFPKTITHFLNQGDDSIFTLFYSWSLWLGQGGDSKYTLVLFGGLLGSIYSFLQFLSAPLWGKFSDRFGRKTILLFTTFGSVLGYSLWLFSSQFWMFVLSRVITGVMGGNLSVASAAMADHTDEKSRAGGMGMLGAGIGLGFVMGPLLGGITSTFTFLDPYYTSGTFVIFPVSALFAIIVASLNLVLIVFFLPESKNQSLGSKMIHPILNITSIQSKTLVRLCILNLLFLLSFSGFEFVINFYLSEGFAFSPRDIGFTFLFMGSIIILVQGGVVRKITRIITEKQMAEMGTFSVFVGFLFLIFGESITLVFVALFFLSVGASLVNPGLSSFASLESSQAEQGMSLGLFRSFGSLARAFSPLIFAVLFFQKGPKFTFILSTVILSVFWLLLYKTKSQTRGASEKAF